MDEIKEFERKRDKIKKELIEIGDMRRGSVTKQYLPVKHIGEAEPTLCGPYYVFTTKTGRKTIGRRLQGGPELEKITREVKNFHHFQRICRELITVNEQICESRPWSEDMLDDKPGLLKKKLPKKSRKKRARR